MFQKPRATVILLRCVRRSYIRERETCETRAGAQPHVCWNAAKLPFHFESVAVCFEPRTTSLAFEMSFVAATYFHGFTKACCHLSTAKTCHWTNSSVSFGQTVVCPLDKQ